MFNDLLTTEPNILVPRAVVKLEYHYHHIGNKAPNVGHYVCKLGHE